MNSLSLFIYAAEVVPNIGITIGIAAGFLVVASGVSALATAIHNDSISSFPSLHAGEIKRTYELPRKFAYVALIIALVASLIPSQQTIYLIAGSEVGEAVVISQEGREIISDIQEIIRQQLASLKEKN